MGSGGSRDDERHNVAKLKDSIFRTTNNLELDEDIDILSKLDVKFFDFKLEIKYWDKNKLIKNLRNIFKNIKMFMLLPPSQTTLQKEMYEVKIKSLASTSPLPTFFKAERKVLLKNWLVIFNLFNASKGKT